MKKAATLKGGDFHADSEIDVPISGCGTLTLAVRECPGRDKVSVVPATRPLYSFSVICTAARADIN